jgi:hypothetical protein
MGRVLSVGFSEPLTKAQRKVDKRMIHITGRYLEMARGFAAPGRRLFPLEFRL